MLLGVVSFAFRPAKSLITPQKSYLQHRTSKSGLLEKNQDSGFNKNPLWLQVASDFFLLKVYINVVENLHGPWNSGKLHQLWWGSFGCAALWCLRNVSNGSCFRSYQKLEKALNLNIDYEQVLLWTNVFFLWWSEAIQFLLGFYWINFGLSLVVAFFDDFWCEISWLHVSHELLWMLVASFCDWAKALAFAPAQIWKAPWRPLFWLDVETFWRGVWGQVDLKHVVIGCSSFDVWNLFSLSVNYWCNSIAIVWGHFFKFQ